MLGVLQIRGNIFICLGWLVFRPLRRGEGKVLSTHFSPTPCLLSWSNAVGIHPHCFPGSGLNINCQCLGFFGRGRSPEEARRLPRWLSGKQSACQNRRLGFNPWVRKTPWRRAWPPAPIFLAGESRGQRSLVRHSPWGCKESDMMEHTSTGFSRLW